ncbi:MAG: TldD/PmbA family protein [Candidatus Methanofastidiosia archaeon]
MVELSASRMVKEASSMGVDEVVCQVINERSQQVRFSRNEITVAKEYNTVNADIFVAKGNKNTKFTLQNVEKIEEDMKRAIRLLDKMQESKDYYGIAKGPFEYRKRGCDKSIAQADAVGLTYEAIEACEAERIAGVLYTRYQDVDFASTYTEGTDERAYIEISCRAFEKESSGHGVSCSATLKDFDGVKAAKDASDLAKKSQNPVKGEEGHYDLLFTPLCFATLMSGGMYSVSAFFVDSGISFFWGKMGKKVASEKFTMSNDGIMEDGIFSTKFDKEGVPTRRTPIIKEGVLENFLHNTSTAKKFGTETTANAGLDAPEPQNIVIAKGGKFVDALVGEVKKGLLVSNTWYTRFQNYMTGDFSTIPRDAILGIEDGAITGAVKNIRISDNMLRLLENVDGLSRDQEQIHWWECDYPVFSPYVLVKDINITTSTK